MCELCYNLRPQLFCQLIFGIIVSFLVFFAFDFGVFTLVYSASGLK